MPSRTYKAVHYDHGMGMAVADVFGDGFLDIYFVDQWASASFGATWATQVCEHH